MDVATPTLRSLCPHQVFRIMARILKPASGMIGMIVSVSVWQEGRRRGRCPVTPWTKLCLASEVAKYKKSVSVTTLMRLENLKSKSWFQPCA